MLDRDLTDNPTFWDLQEPAAVYFTYVDRDRYDYLQKHKSELISLNSLYQKELVDYLQEKRYPAVADTNPLVAHPATIVVSKSGIQTPFMEPEEARDFAIDLLKAIKDFGFVVPMSNAIAVRLEQLPVPILREQTTPNSFEHLRHPDGALLDYIEYRYGPDFINKQIDKAWRLSEDATPLLNHKHDVQNLDEPLFTGRKLTTRPHYSNARNDSEGRYSVFATPNYANSARYCGYKKDKSRYGLIHSFHKSELQVYYDDFGLESGCPAETDPLKQVETVVVPDKNPYLGLEVYLGGRRFIVPPEDKTWEAFVEFNRAAYMPNNENMAQRRVNILKDAKQNNNRAVCYMPVGIKVEDLLLEPCYTQAISEVNLDDVLLDEPSHIRREYTKHNFAKSIETMTEKVKAMKHKDQSASDKSSSYTPEPIMSLTQNIHG